MNLREFLNYKTKCPLCGANLVTSFQSKGKRIIYEGNCLKIFTTMYALSKRKSKDYTVCYSIDLDTNDFFVEFYTLNSDYLFEKSVPISIIQKFIDYNNNCKKFSKFYKECSECKNYLYSTIYFDIDLKKSNIGELKVTQEQFGLYEEKENYYKIYNICNFYDQDLCLVLHDQIDGFNPREIFKYKLKSLLELKPISFSTKEDMLKKINNLIIFS